MSYRLPFEDRPPRHFCCSFLRPRFRLKLKLPLLKPLCSPHAFTFYSLPTIPPPHWLLVPATVLTHIKSSPSSVSNLNFKVNPIVFLAYSLRAPFFSNWVVSFTGKYGAVGGRKDYELNPFPSPRVAVSLRAAPSTKASLAW